MPYSVTRTFIGSKIDAVAQTKSGHLAIEFKLKQSDRGQPLEGCPR